MRPARFTGRKPLSETGQLLTEVSMGRRPADRVITGGRLVNVHTREILDADHETFEVDIGYALPGETGVW